MIGTEETQLLIQSQFGEFECLIDTVNYSKVREVVWYVRVKCGKPLYVWSRKYGMLHRFILDARKNDPLIDHIDRNPLNNKVKNLRFASKAENAINTLKKSGEYTSRYKGVSYEKHRGFYRCRVKGIEIGAFKSEIAAANAYNFYVKQIYELPKLNDVPSCDWLSEKVYRGKSIFRGVRRSKKKWEAIIWINGEIHRLGRFDREVDAALTYNTTALSLGFSPLKLNVLDHEYNVLFDLSNYKGGGINDGK
ncbi:HNH endonuclease [Bacillus subtilis]|uniref:HNH endonuclease n=1 Tax=Bacillus subtilis TaxID=1423 RepID=UPI003CEF567A